MSTPATAAREGARRPDGQFGTYSLGEDAGVSLAEPETEWSEDLSEPMTLSRPMSAGRVEQMRESLTRKVHSDLIDAGSAATSRSEDFGDNYSLGYALASSQALAALDPSVDVSDLSATGAQLRFALSQRGVIPGVHVRSLPAASEISVERSGEVSRHLLRSAALSAKTAEQARESDDEALNGLANGRFNGYVYNACSFAEGTPDTSYDGHANAARVLRDWARDESSRPEDLDDPETFERLCRDAFAPERHDFED